MQPVDNNVQNEPQQPVPTQLPVQVIPTPTPATDTPPQPAASNPNKKQTGLKKLLLVVGLVILLAAAVASGYYLGDKHGAKMAKPAASTAPVVKAITLPPEAIVTAECTAGRGKQYIIPKDIPKGPIYDVNNGKVVAVEYLIVVKDLLTSPDTFSDTINTLMKDYTVDHFSLVPTQPHAGETDQHVHLIMFVVPKDEAAKITCTAATGTTDMNMNMSTPTTTHTH